MNEGSGASVADSTASPVTGTIAGANFSWVAGAPFAGSNVSPVAGDDAATTSEDTAVTIGVLANDSDADGDAVAVASVSAPSHGTAVVNAEGTIAYTPAADYSGSDSFTYIATDSQGGLSAAATVSVTISNQNDAPSAANDSYSTSEDTPLVMVAPGVLGNDSDPDGDAITASLVSGPLHGTLTLNPNGSFSYTPAADFNGTDTFTYRAGDGSLNSSVATVGIEVIAVNDAPGGVADSYSLAEDTTLSVDAPGVLGNDVDAEGDSLSAFALSAPSHGLLQFNADGSFSYTPEPDFSGIDGFTTR